MKKVLRSFLEDCEQVLRENIVAPRYSSPEFEVKTNHYISTPYGGRFLDIAVLRYNKETGKHDIVEKSFEVKIGKSSYRRQRKIDDWLFEQGIIESPVILQRFKNISPDLFKLPETRLSNPTVERQPGTHLNNPTVERQQNKISIWFFLQ